MRRTLAHLLARWALAVLATVATALPSLAQDLTVAIDSSFGEAMAAVARDFEAGRRGVRVLLEAGSSGELLERISQGLVADVLAGVDVPTMERGEQRRLLLPEPRSSFATNTLVLVVPASRQVPVQRVSDLARPEIVRIAMGRPTSMPAGRYAREAINAQRLWSSLQRKVVIVDDVRDVVSLVAGADAQAGFVYASDAAAAAGRVRVVETLSTATPIHHAATVVAASTNPVLAREFVAYLHGDAARAVFRRFGFGEP
ncbi:molybdate ABC transporter substrate-binding protein [Azohydromonas caseinilytica]|uniref:Molybdate ABC transporter substrate-binding protein n=1 Tax=Azohydromonas caseinilytica TaxID=2728836 RepID=A0A848FGH1_9BURK|nr:molybdate ABC transporter substrate-binding protein [Azohydromonas caseinilytica]NML17353.1 molybdate ABC transporter substrate-binding protein [Azohydromonas caseinilytica]